MTRFSPWQKTFVVFALITPLCIWALGAATHKIATAWLIDNSQASLRQYVQGLNSSLELHQRAAELLSFHPQVTAALLGGNDATTALNQQLQRLNNRYHTRDLFIVDASGNTVATSNWRSPHSFLGTNHASRPYFKSALSGRAFTYTSIGGSSGELGVYFSHPIWRDGEVLGVAVVKADLQEHGQLAADLGIQFVIADTHGVVFFASDNRWSPTALRSLSDRNRQKIAESKQYSDLVLFDFPARVTSWGDAVSAEVALSDSSSLDDIPEAATHIAQSIFLFSPGWEVRGFFGLKPVEHAVWAAWGLAALLCLAGVLLAVVTIQRKAYVQALHHAAIHDPLTGLYTRRYMNDVVGKFQAQIRRGQAEYIAVAILDIDHFKRINDHYGHPAGDEVLKRVATTVQKAIRAEDIAVRYGGEEFVLVLNSKHVELVSTGLERIRKSVAALKFNAEMAKEVITMSGGVVLCQLDEEIDSAIARADKLLYQAKTDGRDRLYAGKELLEFEAAIQGETL